MAAAPDIIQRYGKHGQKENEKEGFVELIFEFLRAVKKIDVNETWNIVNCIDLKGTPQQLYEQMKFDSSAMSGQMEDIARTFVPEESVDSSALFNKVNDFIAKKSSGEDASTYSNRRKDDATPINLNIKPKPPKVSFMSNISFIRTRI